MAKTKPRSGRRWQCPHCGKLTYLNQKRENLPGDVQRVYFKCDHCKKGTTAYYTDRAIRKLLARQKTLQNNGALNITAEARAAELDSNQAEVNRLMDELRARMEPTR